MSRLAEVTAVVDAASENDVKVSPPRPTPLIIRAERALSSVQVARRVARPWLSHVCRMPEDRVESFLIMLSELVTNAVEHGIHNFVLVRAESRGNGWVRLDVDNSTVAAIPLTRPTPVDSERGRGLWLVKVLVAELGGKCGHAADGAVAWCEVPLQGSDPPPEEAP